jgi:nicotinate phosphoribosyltransferase
MSALNTDLYELTMAAGYFAAGKANDVATFELAVRRLPESRNFLLAAGLEQVIEYLTSLRFE